MECLLQKLKALRSPKQDSPIYRRQRTAREKTSQASTSDTSSYYSASSNFIDKTNDIDSKSFMTLVNELPRVPPSSHGEYQVDSQFHARKDGLISRILRHVGKLRISTTRRASATCLLQQDGTPPHWGIITCKEFCLFIDCVGPVVTQFGKRLITSANTNNDNLSLHIRQQNSQNVKGKNVEKIKVEDVSVKDFILLSARQVTKYWYEEIKSYNFFQDPSLLHTRAGHFTQMVWRSSTDFGVGKAKSRCGKVIVVANYKPAGNVIGEFQDNVFPPVNDMDILNEI
ncbi:uncharacterized protein [Parasteatoda tepidariorum]|uniref:uncharacterized protein n=1 Tax=Parasteatoda tepidariorum TaxID=114398 RepID=UPI0039BC391E